MITPPYPLPKCGRLLYGQATFMLDDGLALFPLTCLAVVDRAPGDSMNFRKMETACGVTAVIELLTTDFTRTCPCPRD